MARDQVFISYSHADRKWLQRLQTQLKPIVRAGAIDVWDDRRIKAGARWQGEIAAALARARVAVLLVTPEFLASDFVAERELPTILNAARDDGLSVLWVAVKHSAYRDTEIAAYQAVNDPTRPLSVMHHAYVDAELVQICVRIKEAFGAPTATRTAAGAAMSEAIGAGRRPQSLPVSVVPDPAESVDLFAVGAAVARALCGGTIVRVASWAVPGSAVGRRYLAVLRSESERDSTRRALFYEPFGRSYRLVWSSDDHNGMAWENAIFELVDLDGDGVPELVYSTESFGTGAGLKTLTLYRHASAERWRLEEHYSWDDPAGPAVPEISIGPANGEPAFRTRFEEFAVARGFLAAPPNIELDDPAAADRRWLSENGSLLNGPVILHAFAGAPTAYKHSVAAEVREDRYHFIALFKGPLVCHDRRSDVHFVVFASRNVYNWITCLAWDGTRIWGAVHGHGLIAFDTARTTLGYFIAFAGTPLDGVDDLMFIAERSELVVNKRLRIPLSRLDRLDPGETLD